MLSSIADEPEADTDASVADVTPLIALARELDLTRPVGKVNTPSPARTRW
jgi:hypothetical protein